MSNATQYLQKKLIDKTLGIADWTMPASVHLALLTANPGEEGSLSSEIVGGNYARVDITSLMGSADLSTGIITNESLIGFPTPSAAWGMIGYWAVCDAATGGNVLFYGALQTAMLVSGADFPPNFQIGSIAIRGVFASNYPYPTAYLIKKWLDHAFAKASFTMPAGVYLGAFTTDPGSAGSQAGEVVGGGYGRQPLTSKMAAAVLATGTSVNTDGIAFADPTADWGTPTHFGILDALTAGNMLFRRARETATAVPAGSRPLSIGVGQLAVRAA